MNADSFKTFKQELQITSYGKYYINKVLSHLKIIECNREVNLNQYFDTKNQITDRVKFISALKYIESAGELPGKQIKFIDSRFETFKFGIKKIIKWEK